MSNDKQPSAEQIKELAHEYSEGLKMTNWTDLGNVFLQAEYGFIEGFNKANEFADLKTKALRDKLDKTTEILIDSQKVCRNSITDNAILIGKNTWLECQLNEVKEQNKQLAEAIQCILKSDNDEAKLHSLFKANAVLTNYQNQTKD